MAGPTRSRLAGLARPAAAVRLPAGTEHAATRTACATKILSTLARRAYRRPPTSDDIQTLVGFYQAARAQGDFDAGIRAGIERVLVSPDFLFRIETDPAGAAPGTAYALPDVELASRLSFFLWSSIPDDELLDTAIRGKLHEPAVLDRQVRRMLGDTRARTALVQNFFEEWLQTRNVWLLTPDLNQKFPWFDDNLRVAFVKEMELFLDAQLKEDRSIVDLLTSDQTFLNEQLARHYGISGVYGSHFRRVTLTDENRFGLLGKAAVLSVTSYSTRTAPTIRGKYLLENILAAPPPRAAAQCAGARREQQGRQTAIGARNARGASKNPVCASCHARMDPLGLSLENFDAIGQWRTTDAGTPINASGVLLDGTKVDGPAALRRALVAQKEQFVRTVTGKLLTYAIGRGLEYYDAPAIRGIVRAAAADDYRWSSTILALVKSAPFRMRRTGIMIVTKKAISRRTILRGMGATVALPLLDAMIPALTAAGRDAGESRPSPGRRLPSERRHLRQMAAEGRGRRFRVLAHACRTAAVQGQADRRDGPVHGSGRGAGRRRRRSFARVRRVPERRARQEIRYGRRGRHFDGPDRGAGRSSARRSSRRSSCRWTTTASSDPATSATAARTAARSRG